MIKNKIFNCIKISIASPDTIRKWSSGEIKKADTVNYRTVKPENNGLFCAKIFGPVQDYECLCGKYKKIKYRGTICEKCGIEIISSKVRRERMGHIELASPIVHIWFLKSLPSRISVILNINLKKLEKILNYDSYIINDPGITKFLRNELITEEKYNEIIINLGEYACQAGTGPEIIREMLKSINLKKIKKKFKKTTIK